MIGRTPRIGLRRAAIARMLAASALAIGALAAAARPARALIDPSFTPVQLVKDAQRIVAGKLAAATQPDRWTLADIRTLKGAKAAELRLSLAIANPTDARDARGFLQSAAGSDAVLFHGEQASYLLVSNVWMEARPADGGGFDITEFRNQRLPKTYTGAADKLIAMADYILHDPDADVPVAAGVKWSSHVPVGKLPGPPVGMTVLVGRKKAGDRLFVACREGDRLFAFDKAKGRFEDRTRASGLDTASRAWGFVDLNRDGLADLVTWDGDQLRVLFGDKMSGFAPAKDSKPFPLPGPCNALIALSPGQDGSPGLLVDRGRPELLAWAGNDWKRHPLPGDSGRQPPAEGNSCCLVADWDGDGYVDILQVRDDDSRMWRGAKGGFAEPKACNVRGGGFPMRWCIGDFDTDGRLDLLVCGRKGNELWENAGDGKWQPVARFAGSLDTLEPGVADCLAADLNHDGRPDVVTLGPAGQFGYHFNRGYRCLADEGSLKLDAEPPAATQPSAATQPEAFRPVRAVAGDFDGDGSLDLAIAYTTGEVFCFLNGQFADQPAPPGLWIRLPTGRTGPVTVSVWQGDDFPVCVGAYLVHGHQSTYAALRGHAGCTLKWRWPTGPLRSLKVGEQSEALVPTEPVP